MVTHAHADHVTGAAPLKQAFPWMTITAADKTKDLLSKEKIQCFFSLEDRHISSRILELGTVKEKLFNRYFVREATIFSPENTRYCMDLLIRRILDSEAGARIERKGGAIKRQGFLEFSETESHL